MGLLRLKFLPWSTLDVQCLAAIGSIFADKKRTVRRYVRPESYFIHFGAEKCSCLIIVVISVEFKDKERLQFKEFYMFITEVPPYDSEGTFEAFPHFPALLALLGFLHWEGGEAPGPGQDGVRRQGVTFAEFRRALHGQGKCIER